MQFLKTRLFFGKSILSKFIDANLPATKIDPEIFFFDCVIKEFFQFHREFLYLFFFISTGFGNFNMFDFLT